MSAQKLLTNDALFLEPKDCCKRCMHFIYIKPMLGVAFCHYSSHTCSKRYRLSPWFVHVKPCELYEFKGHIQLSLF